MLEDGEHSVMLYDPQIFFFFLIAGRFTISLLELAHESEGRNDWSRTRPTKGLERYKGWLKQGLSRWQQE